MRPSSRSRRIRSRSRSAFGPTTARRNRSLSTRLPMETKRGAPLSVVRRDRRRASTSSAGRSRCSHGRHQPHPLDAIAWQTRGQAQAAGLDDLGLLGRRLARRSGGQASRKPVWTASRARSGSTSPATTTATERRMVVAIVELADVPDAEDRGEGVALLVHDPRGIGVPAEHGGLETLGEALGGLPGLRLLLPQPLALLVHRLRVEAQVAQAIRLHRQHLAELVRGNLVIVEERVVFAGEGVGLPAHLPDSPIVFAGAGLRRARVHGVLGEVRQTRRAGASPVSCPRRRPRTRRPLRPRRARPRRAARFRAGGGERRTRRSSPRARSRADCSDPLDSRGRPLLARRREDRSHRSRELPIAGTRAAQRLASPSAAPGETSPRIALPYGAAPGDSRPGPRSRSSTGLSRRGVAPGCAVQSGRHRLARVHARSEYTTPSRGKIAPR